MIAADLLDRLRLRPARPAGVRTRAAPSRRGRRILPRLRPTRIILILIPVALLLGGGWLWLRHSSLVAIEHVTITGASGPDGAQIRDALQTSAQNMTTLDVRTAQLRNAVAGYPVVKGLQVSTQFPHGIRIHVIENVPVGAVLVAGRTIPVAGDGTLLHDVAPQSSLPTIPLRVPPGGTRLTDQDALAAVQLLSAAPSQMLSKVSEVTTVASHGLVAQIRNGPSIYFGDASRARAKWLAAAAVLAAPGSVGALYIDVTYPDRPAAGSGSSASSSGTSATGTAASATTSAIGTSASSSGTSATGTAGSATSSAIGTAASSTTPSSAATPSGGIATTPQGP